MVIAHSNFCFFAFAPRMSGAFLTLLSALFFFYTLATLTLVSKSKGENDPPIRF